MSRFSRCAKIEKLRPPLPGRRMVMILLTAAIVLGFGLTRLQLQFALNDLEQETTRLQVRRMELQSQVNLLRSEVEFHKTGDRLLEIAGARLGMVRSVPENVDRITVTPEIQDRYAGTELARIGPADGLGSAGSELAQAEGSRRPWIEILSARAGFVSRAFAEGEGE